MKFAAEILLSGKTATGIRVPPKIVAGLGSSKKPAVRVTIKGYSYPDSALAKDTNPRKFFESLSHSNKLRIILTINGAMSDETGQRRIARAVETLHLGRL